MLENLKMRFVNSKAVRAWTGVLALTAAMPVTAWASSADTGTSSSVLDGVTTVLDFYLKTMTSITTWLIGNQLGAIYIAIFIIGCAVALMFRILHSA